MNAKIAFQPAMVRQPVRVIDDCLGWLTADEFQREALLAYRGAVGYMRTHDFRGDAVDTGYQLCPHSLEYSDGDGSCVDREYFASLTVFFLRLRIERLAVSRGLDLSAIDHSFNDDHPDWEPWLALDGAA